MICAACPKLIVRYVRNEFTWSEGEKRNGWHSEMRHGQGHGELMKTKLKLLLILIILLLQTGCLYAVRYDGSYHGKVVDIETREPLEGVVVLGTWSVYHFDVGGGHSTYHDARETVTDKNGEFTISGEGLRILSSLQPMSFIIFKTGYSYFDGSWDTLKTDYYSLQVVKWDGETPIIPIRKMTMEERRKIMTFPPIPPTEATVDKIILMLKEINKEAIERGVGTIEIWRGKRI